MFRRLLFVLLCFAVCSSARAAELRVSLKELASLLNPVLATTKLRLHNVPSDGIFGGLFDPTKSSYASFGGTEVPLDFPVTTFPLTGIGDGRYAYYLNDINSNKIEIRASSNALVLVISFESSDAELVGSCYSGTCGFGGALPIVEWRKPQIRLHLKPTRYENGISLDANRIVVGGHFKTRCRSGNLICLLGQSAADAYINRLRRRFIPAQILKRLNSAATREMIGAQLSQYLRLGTSGQVVIRKVTVGNSAVRVSFRLP